MKKKTFIVKPPFIKEIEVISPSEKRKRER
jgi:hypothetical protein